MLGSHSHDVSPRVSFANDSMIDFDSFAEVDQMTTDSELRIKAFPTTLKLVRFLMVSHYSRVKVDSMSEGCIVYMHTCLIDHDSETVTEVAHQSQDSYSIWVLSRFDGCQSMSIGENQEQHGFDSAYCITCIHEIGWALCRG